jgi:hypothetical protein
MDESLVKHRSDEQLNNLISHMYLEELCNTPQSLDKELPKHLYSFNVYCAYKKAWQLVNLFETKQEEIDVMKSLGLLKHNAQKCIKVVDNNLVCTIEQS